MSRENPSKPRQQGLAKGLCKICGEEFALNKHTQHSKNKLLKNVICSTCGKKSNNKKTEVIPMGEEQEKINETQEEESKEEFDKEENSLADVDKELNESTEEEETKEESNEVATETEKKEDVDKEANSESEEKKEDD